jgi:hypothetical protein
MPILIYEKVVHVVSFSEFVQAYRKICPEEKPILERLTKGFEFTASVGAMSRLWAKRKETYQNEDPPRLFSFNYQGNDAQNIAMELLVLFAALYHSGKLFISDGTNNVISIQDYLLPHGHHYNQIRPDITVMDNRFKLEFSIIQIREIRGIINNFVIHLDNQLIHFCYDGYYGKKINIVQHNYDFYKDRTDRGYTICDYDYVFDRGRPRWSFLRRFRRNGFLVIIS